MLVAAREACIGLGSVGGDVCGSPRFCAMDDFSGAFDALAARFALLLW